jgi:hypothetical protein
VEEDVVGDHQQPSIPSPAAQHYWGGDRAGSLPKQPGLPVVCGALLLVVAVALVLPLPLPLTCSTARCKHNNCNGWAVPIHRSWCGVLDHAAFLTVTAHHLVNAIVCVTDIVTA